MQSMLNPKLLVALSHVHPRLRRQGWSVLSALRGPDVFDPLHQSLKEKYVSVLRSWALTEEAIESQHGFMALMPDRPTLAQVKEALRGLREESSVGVSMHFLRHLDDALCAAKCIEEWVDG